MKIVYMGTPDFAVSPLRALHDAGHDIVLAITQPDAVRDRGKKVKFSPVKEEALRLGIEVIQPERIKNDREAIDRIKSENPDIIAVAAFGQILPKEVLDIPKLGCINVHASLLPRFRGASPIQRAIMEGDEKTGVTIMYMEEGLDTGDMLAKKSVEIDHKTADELHDELSALGAELLVDTVGRIREIKAVKQDDSMATYAPMISKADGHIDFSQNPYKIERMIRAFDSWPGTYAEMNGKTVKLWKAEAKDEKASAADGTVINVEDGGICIAAGGGVLKVTEIQMPGRKRVSVKEFLKGNSIEIGTVLG
ncbi:MAG: methionyl-tRNA formyltransferase [Anaerovoracaceae bacterium]|uniref:Methionyl-tRNA formyltransferase n=1 Tax=Candidatus Allocopromorpha excrementavium TaxID=2840741 RepID=A0A9D1HCR4_9FIRM|nr:methionyl-tRNA formyltransferase [Candidatus Copromorpha excrementavium]